MANEHKASITEGKQRLSVYLDSKVVEKLQILAKEDSRSVSSYLNKMLDNLFSSNGNI